MELTNIPIYRKYNNEKKIAFLDTSSVSFMNGLDDKGFRPDSLLKDYDVILIPQWVAVEIFDSPERATYMQKLIENNLPIKIVEVTQYSDLIDSREGDLFKIVCASVGKIASIKGYLRRFVEKDDPIDMDAYKDWIQKMYDNWPSEQKILESGRIKKKNAGEISITILAEIFSWYHSTSDVLTIYSQDRDTFDYLCTAEYQLECQFRNKMFVPISYKSNDAILCQMFRNKEIKEDDVFSLRRDIKRVTYIQTKADKSIAMTTQVMENEDFIQLLKDESYQIIF